MGSILARAEPDSAVTAGLPTSLVAHAALLVALLAVVAPRRYEAPPAPGFEVEIVAPPAAAVRLAPARPAAPEITSETTPAPAVVAALPPDSPSPPATPPAGATPPATPARPGMVQATRMYSARLLTDPQHRSVRQALAAMADDDRVDQLCGLEAMEQVTAWNGAIRPDRVVSYAAAETRLDGDTLVADGAAFHTRDGWRRLRFACGLSPDRSKVVAFAFRVGPAIPPRDRERFNLPDEAGGTDE